jgi:hypothetical protein
MEDVILKLLGIAGVVGILRAVLPGLLESYRRVAIDGPSMPYVIYRPPYSNDKNGALNRPGKIYLKAPPQKTISNRFRELTEKWKKDVGPLSSVTEIVMHPAYQEIIGMGPAVIPLILHELKRDPVYWFWALKAITGDDPVAPEKRGRIKEMRDEWLEWGKKEGLI